MEDAEALPQERLSVLKRPRRKSAKWALIGFFVITAITVSSIVSLLLALEGLTEGKFGLAAHELPLLNDGLKEVVAERLAIVAESEQLGLMAGISGVAGFIGVFLFFRSLGGTPQPVQQPLVLKTDSKGIVVIGSDGVAKVAETAVLQTDDVLGVQVRVQGSGQSPVLIKVGVLVHAQSDLTKVGAASAKAARESVENLTGLKVQDVVVDVAVATPEQLERRLVR